MTKKPAFNDVRMISMVKLLQSDNFHYRRWSAT